MGLKWSNNCLNKNCMGGVITYNGQTGRLCKKCNPDKKKIEMTDAEKFLRQELSSRQMSKEEFKRKFPTMQYRKLKLHEWNYSISTDYVIELLEKYEKQLTNDKNRDKK